MLSHAHFIEVVPEADDLTSGRLGVGLVKYYGVGLLRGFARPGVQVEFSFLFTLDHSAGDISRDPAERLVCNSEPGFSIAIRRCPRSLRPD